MLLWVFFQTILRSKVVLHCPPMSESESTPVPPREVIAPRHESVRSAFDDELENGEPAYGEAKLWLVAHGPHDLFAYWEFDAAEHPEVLGADGATHFFLRPLREDGFAEPTVEIPHGASNAHIPVSQADTLYTAELGFFAPGGVWCFVAHSDGTRTPPDDTPPHARSTTVPEAAAPPMPWTTEQERELQRLLDQDTKLPSGE